MRKIYVGRYGISLKYVPEGSEIVDLVWTKLEDDDVSAENVKNLFEQMERFAEEFEEEFKRAEQKIKEQYDNLAKKTGAITTVELAVLYEQVAEKLGADYDKCFDDEEHLECVIMDKKNDKITLRTKKFYIQEWKYYEDRGDVREDITLTFTP